MTSFLQSIAPTASLRTLAPREHPRVTNTELFFDLVYVFTIIQLSHFLLAHATPIGALQAATLFAAVWWAWNLTAWAANWIDPDHAAGRTLMILLMACALLMAVAAPYAFGDRAWLFAGAYIAMALIRGVYMSLVFRGQVMGRNYTQLTVWNIFAAVFWVLGAAIPEYRLALWILAVLIDYVAPSVKFWLPGLGGTPMESWPLKGLHLLERNQLIFIIALGESILLLGGTLVKGGWTTGTWIAAGIGFLLIVSVWWNYFVHTSEEGEHALGHRSEEDHTRLARSGLAYAHGIMVAGAIVVAVAIEEILLHPEDAVHLPTVLFATVGPGIFYVGSSLFYSVMSARIPRLYLVAVIALAVWGYIALAAHVSAIVLGAGVLTITVVTVGGVSALKRMAKA